MRHILHGIRDDESGATAIEYGLITLLIVVVIAAGVRSIGLGVVGLMTSVAGAF